MPELEEKGIDSPKKKNLNEQWKELDIVFQIKIKKLVKDNDRDKFNTYCTELGFNETQKELLFDAVQTYNIEIPKYPPIPFTTYPPMNHLKPPMSIHSNSVSPSRPIANINHIQNNNTNTNTMDTSSNHSSSNYNHNNYITRSSPKRSLYAIPSNKNEALSGSKRKRISDDDNLDDSDDDDDEWNNNEEIDDDDDDYIMKEPKPKKRKKHKTKDKKKRKNKKKRKCDVNDADDTLQNLWNKDSNLTEQDQHKLEDDDVYIVENIIGHKRIGNNKYKYNVKWEGYDDLTWEPALHLNDYVVTQYWKEKGIKTDPEGAMVHLAKGGDDEEVDDEDTARKQKKKESPKKRKVSTPKKRTKSKTRSKSKSKSPKRKKKVNAAKDGNENKKDWRCEPCNRSFSSGQALGGHNAAKHKKKDKEKEGEKDRYWEDSDEEREREVLVIEDDD